LTTPASAGVSFFATNTLLFELWLNAPEKCKRFSQASLKSASCLSKFTQTWREKPANCSDMTRFSGKSFRLGEKIRLH